jgi:hypothetical protein
VQPPFVSIPISGRRTPPLSNRPPLLLLIGRRATVCSRGEHRLVFPYFPLAQSLLATSAAIAELRSAAELAVTVALAHSANHRHRRAPGELLLRRS